MREPLCGRPVVRRHCCLIMGLSWASSPVVRGWWPCRSSRTARSSCRAEGSCGWAAAGGQGGRDGVRGVGMRGGDGVWHACTEPSEQCAWGRGKGRGRRGSCMQRGARAEARPAEWPSWRRTTHTTHTHKHTHTHTHTCRRASFRRILMKPLPGYSHKVGVGGVYIHAKQRLWWARRAAGRVQSTWLWAEYCRSTHTHTACCVLMSSMLQRHIALAVHAQTTSIPYGTCTVATHMVRVHIVLLISHCAVCARLVRQPRP